MTVPGARVDWRGLDRAALDKAYNSAAAAADQRRHRRVLGWECAGAATAIRKARPCLWTAAAQPNQFHDMRAPSAPTFVFIHGGYWQMRAKENFAFVAGGPLSIGINVALVGYTLAPEASIDEMAAEIRRLDWFTAELPALGGDPEKVLLRDGRPAHSLPSGRWSSFGSRLSRDQWHLRPRADAALLCQRQARP